MSTILLANKSHSCLKLQCSFCQRSQCQLKQEGWPTAAPDCESFVTKYKKNKRLQSKEVRKYEAMG